MPSFAKKEKKDKVKKKKHYSGIYNGIEYFSCLELATILHCESLNLKIENCNIGPIPYWDAKKNKFRKYYPDFLVEGFLVLEVKWLGFIFEKKKDEIHAKKKALEDFCREKNLGCLFVTNNLVKKKYVEKAKTIHNAKNNSRKNLQNKRNLRSSRRSH